MKRITYYDNGNKCEEGFYKNGKKEGEWASWNENGDKELISYFKMGKPTNIWIHWDKNGDYDWVDMNHY